MDGLWIRINKAEAEVERLKAANKRCAEIGSSWVKTTMNESDMWKALAEKAEAERDEWRDKAMFQKGRADEALAIAKPSVIHDDGEIWTRKDGESK
jgi:hypothetical protein